MSKKRLVAGIGGIALILLGIILYFSWPLMFGEDVVLHAQQVDPFDVFRGQYLAIRYDISAINTTLKLKNGDAVYVSLKKSGELQRGIFVFEYDSISTTKPGNLFLKGTVDDVRLNITNTSDSQIIVHYGIEQYFFERNAKFDVRNLTVHAKIDGNGNARIAELLQNGKLLNVTYDK